MLYYLKVYIFNSKIYIINKLHVFLKLHTYTYTNACRSINKRSLVNYQTDIDVIV